MKHTGSMLSQGGAESVAYHRGGKCVYSFQLCLLSTSCWAKYHRQPKRQHRVRFISCEQQGWQISLIAAQSFLSVEKYLCSPIT